MRQLHGREPVAAPQRAMPGLALAKASEAPPPNSAGSADTGAMNGKDDLEGKPHMAGREDGAATDVQAERFRRFYDAHIGEVYRFLYGRVGNREEAEDLTAQVFTKAARGIDWRREPEEARRWVFQAARTTLADHWRAYYRMPTQSLDALLNAGWDVESPSAAAPPEDVANREDTDDATDADATSGATALVAMILGGVTPGERETLRCRFLLGMTISETAQRLGLTEANVKVLQYRGVRHAARLYAQAGETSLAGGGRSAGPGESQAPEEAGDGQA